MPTRSFAGSESIKFRKTLCLLPAALVIAVLLNLNGCARISREPPPPVSEPELPATTWIQVEREILLASKAARADAAAYAEVGMGLWMSRVRRYTEQDFVPWYSGYWTQQWLAVKVAWYESGDRDGEMGAVSLLAGYLQSQYVARVLEPASRVADPGRLLRQATAIYLRLLAEKIAAIGRYYQIPELAFRQRLEWIPVIAASESEPGVVLARLLDSAALSGLPAYAALLEQVETAGVEVNARLKEGGLSPVARRVADDFMHKLAARGGAAAAAAVVGGPAGIALSLGFTGWSLNEHEKLRPELEAELRAIMEPALAQMERDLLDDPRQGVLGAVNRMQAQIEQALASAPAGFQAPRYSDPW